MLQNIQHDIDTNDYVAYSTGSYDENKTKLRTGNFIETILDAYEGLSTLDTIMAFGLSNTARNNAKSKYPNDTQL